jgi:phenylpropionate dioxygenase-like ring-hydroxylating dioxygenase large terminal subunit
MTRRAENDILTQTGPGTPMGELMRQYWMPALMSSELIADGDPVRFMLMSEKLIAFRDSSGRIGVMDHRCPHRCASLFFGRNEENGIRCVYHGWKFDVDGNCLDQANVPPHQDFKQKVKAKAYKAEERNGLVWVFMGDQENVPQLPPIEATLAPEDDVTITFIQRDCNWLQGAEGELDTSHLGVLHFGSVGEKSFEEDELNKYVVAERAPDYKAAETDYGFIYGAYRPAEAGETYWRVGHFLFPVWTMPPIRSLDRNVMTRAYVPLDDEHCMIVIIVHKNAERADPPHSRRLHAPRLYSQQYRLAGALAAGAQPGQRLSDRPRGATQRKLYRRRWHCPPGSDDHRKHGRYYGPHVGAFGAQRYHDHPHPPGAAESRVAVSRWWRIAGQR